MSPNMAVHIHDYMFKLQTQWQKQSKIGPCIRLLHPVNVILICDMLGNIYIWLIPIKCRYKSHITAITDPRPVLCAHFTSAHTLYSSKITGPHVSFMGQIWRIACIISSPASPPNTIIYPPLMSAFQAGWYFNHKSWIQRSPWIICPPTEGLCIYIGDR